MGVISFKLVTDFKEADAFAFKSSGGRLNPYYRTFWVNNDGEHIGVFQHGQIENVSLFLDKDGDAINSARTIHALQNWAEIAELNPVVVTHTDSPLWNMTRKLLHEFPETFRVLMLRKQEN